MKIGDYDLIRTDRSDLLGAREGRLYHLLPCNGAMTADHAAALTQALDKAILPGSNTLIPAFFEADTGWHCAVPYQEEVFRGLPAAYLRHLPEQARMHLTLLAVSALEALHRGGMVHGSLTADCFRLTVAPGGILCPVLTDLRHAGTKTHPPLCPDRTSPYAAPEVRLGKPPTAASDVFALALNSSSPAPPFAALAPERTCFIAATSEILGGGLRVAYLCPPELCLDELEHTISYTISMVPPLMAELASQWILGGTADAVLRAKREEAAVRNDIARHIFDGWPLASRNSGFFCWLPLPEGWTGIRFADAAREAGVLVAEGEHFLIGHDAPEHGVRLALGGIQDREGLREALNRIAYLLESRP